MLYFRKLAGDENSRSNVLKVAAVPLVPAEACNSKDAYGDQANDGMICAGYMDGGTDSCKGDSGGPLACNIDGNYKTPTCCEFSCFKKNIFWKFQVNFSYLVWCLGVMDVLPKINPESTPRFSIISTGFKNGAANCKETWKTSVLGSHLQRVHNILDFSSLWMRFCEAVGLSINNTNVHTPVAF